MGFGRKGRNPTGNELPSVSAGQRLRPSHINQLASGIDKATLRSGKGYRFVQNSGGTSLQIVNSESAVPWSVFTEGYNLCITAGGVWGKGVSQMPKHTAKEWNSAPADFANKYWTARPVMVGIEGANIYATDEINSAREGQPTRSIVIPNYTAGTYYIEYANWDGRGDITAIGVGATLVGTEQFVLKHKGIESPPSNSDDIAIVCFVDEDLQVYQGVQGDIWWGGSGDSYPFKISVGQDAESVWKIFVAYGTVNNTVPTYQGGGLEVGDPDGGITGIGSGNSVSANTFDVILQLDYSEGDPFPSATPQVFTSTNWNNTPNNETTAYVILGRVVVTLEGEGEEARPAFDIQQATTGSLWAERFKCGNLDPVYWITRI